MASAKDLHHDIEARSFRPAYLFQGDDDFRKNEALTLFLNAAVDPATRDFNLEVRRGPELDAETLGSLLAMPPMLAERRVVVVRDAGNLKKDSKEVVDKYLDRPPSDVSLVLVQPSGDKPEPRFGRALTVDFESLTGPHLSRWVAKRAESAYHATITPEAVELLIEAVGNDLTHLNLEIEKLAAYRNGGTIDDEAIGAIVGVRREISVSALLDAIADRDAAQALAILPRVMEQPKSSGVYITMLLATQVLGTAFAQARLEDNVPRQRLYNELMTMMKEGGAFPGRAWGEAINAWIRTAPNWSMSDLSAAAATLHEADRALKDTGRTTDEGILQGVILTLCRATGRRAA
jgi:DNA polymerase-3 subunit delta